MFHGDIKPDNILLKGIIILFRDKVLIDFYNKSTNLMRNIQKLLKSLF